MTRARETDMQRKRARRSAVSWIPISIVAVICIGIVVATAAMANSWWTDPDRPPSEDQVSVDGMSTFSGPGLDYLTRQGVARIRLTEDATSATRLGLEPDAPQGFTPLVPVAVTVLGPDGAVFVDPIRDITLTTEGDQVQTVTLTRESSGDWLAARADLERVGAQWGWSAEDLAQLNEDLAEASHEQGDTYSAWLPKIEHNGLTLQAKISIDVTGSNTTTVFTVSRD